MRLRHLITAAVLSAAAIPSPGIAAAQTDRPTRSYFALHYLGIAGGTWPEVPAGTVGTVRLWDTGTAWRDIQPAPGAWDWTVLDAAVGNAAQHGAKVNLVLGLTPTWASSRPDLRSYYGYGHTAPPISLDLWRTYVRAVVDRYAGRIAAYEVWNEGALSSFWSGTVAELAQLTTEAGRIIHSVDPGAVVLSPSTLALWRGTPRWLRSLNSAGGLAEVDAIAVHGYPVELTPEQYAAAVSAARDATGLDLPWWDTEINHVSRTAGALSPTDQARYVTRTALLAWDAGIRQVAWYQWGSTGQPVSGWAPSVRFVRDGSPTGATRALSTVRRWMNGDMLGCDVTARSVYRCRIAYSSGSSAVVKWSPDRTVRVWVPRTTRSADGMFGQPRDVAGKRRITVGASPVRFVTR